MRSTFERVLGRNGLAFIVVGVLMATPIAMQAQRAAEPAAAQSPLPTVTLPAELERVLRDYERAWRASDVNGLVALFTSDGMVMQPGRPAARGPAALAAVYRGQGGGPLRLRPFAYASADTVAYILGAYGYAADGTDEGKFTLILRRTGGGRWLIASDMDNSSRPARSP